VADISGIGPRTAAALADADVGSLQELCALTAGEADAIADLVTGLSRAGMHRALAEAQFHLLGDDGAHAAGALVQAGFDTLDALLAASTSRVQTLTGLDEVRALALQVQAARTGLTFQALLRVVDASGAPIPRPALEVTDSGLAGRNPVAVREGDDEGWVLSPPLRRDRIHRLFVTVGGQRRMVRLVAPGSLVLRRTIVLADPPRRSPMTPAKPLVLGRGHFLFEQVALPDCQDQVFRVGATDTGVTCAHAVVRSVVPFGVVTGVLRLPAADVPGSEGDYVTVDAGALRAASDAERDDALRSRGGALLGRWP